MADKPKIVKWNNKRPEKAKSDSGMSVSDFVRKAKADRESMKTEFDYRSASLRIHGHVCAKCGKEFSGKDLQLLTVHHKDGNHDNNPPDGSNWENLCTYCHDDEHARDQLSRHSGGGKSETTVHEDQAGGLKTSLADKLKAAMEKKK